MTESQNRRVRVAAVQFEMRAVPSRDAFYARVEAFVRAAGEYGADFVCFPEHFAAQLLTPEGRRVTADETPDALTALLPEFVERMGAMAPAHGVNVIGGSFCAKTAAGGFRNTAHVFLRDGTHRALDKIHPTPDEREVWHMEGGDRVHAIDTDRGRIGVLVCYDAEFPELPRRLADQGAEILFVPYCTDTRPGHLRLRYCGHARAIENQIFVVAAGTVGMLPEVENFDIHYAQSAILTHSDHPFARDAVAAEATENREMMILADLDLDLLARSRTTGAVRPMADRRPELYRTVWTGPTDHDPSH